MINIDYSIYPKNDVLCIDIRSFYASVEAIKLGLDPLTTLLAVVGDIDRQGSVVLATSPALKKHHGLSNVNRFYELPNDPNIYIVQANMADYIEISAQITNLLYTYVPKEAIHPYSIDETWITVNGLKNLFGSRTQIAEQIKHDIFKSFGLTCAIGIGDNKFLAKVVMDLYAKQEKSSIAECSYEDVQDMLWPISIERVWGIGKRMTDHLNKLGITTLGQLAQFPVHLLKKHFGVIGEQLYWHAWGIDLSPVFGNFLKTNHNSYGHGISLLRDYSKDEALICILDLCEEVCRRARTDQKAGRTIQLSIGYSQETGRGFSRSISIDTPTNITMDIYNMCTQLFNAHYDGTSKIRRISVTLSSLVDDDITQLNFFKEQTKQKDIGYVMDNIRHKFGSTAILRASSYTEAGIIRERSNKIGGHWA